MVKKLTNIRNGIDPEINVKFKKNKIIMEAIKEINEKNELMELAESSMAKTQELNKKERMFSGTSATYNNKAAQAAQAMLQEKMNHTQNIQNVLVEMLTLSLPEKYKDIEVITKVSAALIENVGVNSFLKSKSNIFRGIMEACADPSDLEEKVDDINNIAKILETKINSAINKEKETVVTMQEKTNELIEENKYEKPEEEPETEEELADGNEPDETSEPEEDNDDSEDIDNSMDEYEASFKESFSVDSFFGKLLNESLDEEDEEDEEDDTEEDSYEYEEELSDEEFDERFADLNDTLLDDLDLDELDTELDKLILDEDLYDTSDFTEEELAELGLDEEEEEFVEESVRYKRDSKFNLLVADTQFNKAPETYSLIESIIVGLTPKFLNEAMGDAIDEEKLLTEAVVAFASLELLNTTKVLDFNQGALHKFKRKLVKGY